MATVPEPTKSPPEPEHRPPTAESVVALVQVFVCELHPHMRDRGRFDLDVSLERDLAIDSLARMELIVRVEQHFGVSLSEQTMANAETPRDLLRALHSADTRTSETRLQITEHVGTHVEKPEHAKTLIEVLDWHASAHPERVHVHLYGEDEQTEPITYGEMRTRSREVAAGLIAEGLEPGQAVAIMLPTSADYFYCFLGILLAGGIPVPIYPPVRLSQMEDHVRRHAGILSNALATILITFDQVKPVAVLLKSQVEGLQRIVTTDELRNPTPPENLPVLNEDHIAFLQYTSGSTGNPKGVVLTHANLLDNIRAMDAALATSSRDVFVSWLPLYHDMGLIGGWLGSLYVGFTLVLMSPLTFLSRPARWLRAIHEHRGTVSGGPNFAFELCVRRIDDEEIEGLDLSCWRVAFNGAEPVSADTLRRFQERFAGFGLNKKCITPVYGLAEATLGLGIPPLGRGLKTDRVQRERLALEGYAAKASDDDQDALEVVACGQPMPGYEVRIVDPNRRELPERYQGRLQFKGPSTTSGYYRNPEATKALFDGDWLDSGDLAYITGGDIYITSREKDIIIRAGRNIYPYELEEAVGDLPGARKGCIAMFGSTDPQSQTEKLVVVAETRETDLQVRTALEERINELAVKLVGLPPDDIVLAPPRTVLKTSSGKIRRSATRELYESGILTRGTDKVWIQFARLAVAGVVPQLRRLRRSIAGFAFATWAWLVAAILAVGGWIGVMLSPVPAWRWGIMRACGSLLIRISGNRVTVAGLSNLPEQGAFILVSNHQSYLDGPLLVMTIPQQISYVVKGELARNFVLSGFLRRIGVQFVERFDAQKGIEDAKRIAQVLNAGQPLGYFPEGTIKRMPGLLPFHMGAFQTAAEAGVAVVPVTLRGTRSILRDESWFPRRGTVRVTISPPIAPDPSQDHSTWDQAIRLRDAARSEMLRHCGEPDLVHHRVEIDPKK